MKCLDINLFLGLGRAGSRNIISVGFDLNISSINHLLDGVLKVVTDRGVVLEKSLELSRGISKSWKLVQVTGSHVKGLGIIGGSLFTTFFGSSNVNLVTLESSNTLVDSGNDVGSITDSSGFQEQADAKEDVGEGVAEEGNGEGRSNQLPGNGGNNGGDKSSKESHVEELLGGGRDSPQGRVTGIGVNVKGSDTGNEKHARDDAKLTSNHESRKVESVSMEQKSAGLLGPHAVSTFFLADLGDGEESNLHTFQKSDTGHKEEENNNCSAGRDRFPHGGLSLEKSSQSDGKGKGKNSNGDQAPSEEEQVLEGALGGFVGLDDFSGACGDNHLDDIRSMDQSGKLNGHGDAKSQVVGVVVQVVKHAVRCVDLRVELSDHGGQKNHGKTSSKEGSKDAAGKSPKLGIGNGSSGDVDGKDNEHNHELTSKKVTVEGISSVGKLGTVVGGRVGFLVQLTVDRGKSDKRSLSSFDDGKPQDGEPKKAEGKGGVHILGKSSLFGELKTRNQSDGEAQGDRRDHVLDQLHGGVLFNRHDEILIRSIKLFVV